MFRKITIFQLLVLLLFIIFTNLEAKFLYRTNLLVHNYDGYIGAVIYIFLWFLCIISILTIPFIKNKSFRILFSFLIAIFTLIGFSYEFLSGAQLDYDNLSIMIAANNHAIDALSFYFVPIMIGLFVSCCIFAFLVRNIAVADRFNLIQFKVLQYSVIILPFILILIIAMLRGGYGTDGLPVQYKTASLFTMLMISKAVAETPSRENVNISLLASNVKKPNIVVIMDESVSADFIDINKHRGITPNLTKLKKNIINYGASISSTNCSAGSNIILRTVVNPNNLKISIVKEPYIWSYMKKAGYETTYIEAQAKEGRLNNRMTHKEISLIDNFVYAKGESRSDRDIDSLNLVKLAVTNNAKPAFIFLVKSGIHFPYESSYNVKDAIFSPHMTGGHVVNNKQLMINSYKNAMRLSIDRFWKKFSDSANLNNTIYIYTSDHGQNLLDNGSQLTHCSTSNTSDFESLVPLFVISNDIKIKEKLKKHVSYNFNKTSHFNINPTILEFAGYSKKQIANKLEVNPLSDRLDGNIAKFISGVISEFRISIGSYSKLKWNSVDAIEIKRD